MNKLTLDERTTIHRYLDQGSSIRQIAILLGRAISSVSREIRRNLTRRLTKPYGIRAFNDCAFEKDCDRKRLCALNECSSRHKQYCRFCEFCSEKCPDYVKQVCSRLQKPPYCCTGCEQIRSCRHIKMVYDPYVAHENTVKRRALDRQGSQLTPEELKYIDELISPGIKLGQSLHHVFQRQAGKLPCSERTIYTFVNAGALACKRMDLPRAVRYRPRSSQRKQHKVDRKCRINRTYEDFQAFLEENPDVSVVQMDTVIGKIGGLCILTLFFVNVGLLIGFLRDHNNADSVQEVFDEIERRIGLDAFKILFQCLLTDNGSEFSNPRSLELSPDGLPRTKVFYCNPGRPDQKGAIERSHEHIRRVLPKGVRLMT